MLRLAAPWIEAWLDLLFPPRCALCRNDLGGSPWTADPSDSGRVPLCQVCRRSLTADVARCLLCGERSPLGMPCGRCRQRPHGCAGLVVLGSYGDHLRDVVLRCKRPAGETLTRSLAALLAVRHRGTLASWRVDLIVPVPMHWRRRMARGTSAADELAAGMAARLGVPYRAALRRTAATRMQNELPVADRRGNVAAAFRIRADVTGRRVLLVDDVCTTGSTLRACSHTLLEAGASSVHAAVVAKADRETDEGDE